MSNNSLHILYIQTVAQGHGATEQPKAAKGHWSERPQRVSEAADRQGIAERPTGRRRRPDAPK